MPAVALYRDSYVAAGFLRGYLFLRGSFPHPALVHTLYECRCMGADACMDKIKISFYFDVVSQVKSPTAMK